MSNANVLEYKGNIGTVEFSAKDNVLFGKVLGVNGLVSYEGDSITELRTDFENAVEDYIVTCEELGIEPEKSYKGSFNVRISPQLHKALALFAVTHNITLNATVEKALEEFISSR